MIAKMLKITGDVQGVSYRYFARTEAKKLDLSGFAKNEHDGSVSILIQGTESAVGDFIKWAEAGSPMAEVENVEVSSAEIQAEREGFEVK